MAYKDIPSFLSPSNVPITIPSSHYSNGVKGINSVKVDYVALLPPEIVIQILLCLTVKDVLSSMKVCKQWYEKIKDLTGYWKKAMSILGVSAYIFEQNKDSFPNYFSFVLRVWKNRRYIMESRPEVIYASTRYPNDTYFHCNYSRFGVVAGTLYQDFLPEAITVHKIKPGTQVLRKTNQFDPISYGPVGRIRWLHVYCEYLLFVSASGRWQGYHLATNKKLLDWNGPELFDQDLILSCCESCFLVVIVKLISKRKPKESYWEVQVLRLGRGNSAPSISYHRLDTPYYISPTPSNQGCKYSALISQTNITDGDSFCCTHKFLVQWGDTIVVYEMNETYQIDYNPLAVLQSNKEYDIAVIYTLVTEKYHNTPFVISADNQLFGYIFSDTLHIWNIGTLIKEACVHLPRSDTNNQIWLLAIGHVYSLIGYGSIEGRLKVICTYTGQCIFSTHGFSSVFHSNQTIGTPPPYFYFLGPVDEHWLNNVDALPHPLMPILLYWQKREHCVCGITFKHEEKEEVKLANIAERETTWKIWKKKLKLF